MVAMQISIKYVVNVGFKI